MAGYQGLDLQMLVRIPNRKTLIRLLLQKQPDPDLHCLSSHFGRQVVFEILEKIRIAVNYATIMIN